MYEILVKKLGDAHIMIVFLWLHYACFTNEMIVFLSSYHYIIIIGNTYK